MVAQRRSPSGPVYANDFSVVLDHGTVTASTVAKKTFSVPGMTSNDYIASWNPTGGWKTGLADGGWAWVSDGVAEVYISNPTAGNITTGSVTYRYQVITPDVR